MANQEQLDILEQGVEAWNQWRQEHGTIHPDLSNAYLSRTDLYYYHLSRAHLSRANLSNTENGSLKPAFEPHEENTRCISIADAPRVCKSPYTSISEVA